MTEFAVSLLLTRPSSRFEHVVHVVFVRPVLQILHPIVVRIVVEMTNYATLWLSEKRQCHQIVNPPRVLEAETYG
jgi:hypothetical protein